MHEHDGLCAMLDGLRAATNDYTPPRGACANYRTLCRALRDLELDLLHLIYLEDRVLFPRARDGASRSHVSGQQVQGRPCRAPAESIPKIKIGDPHPAHRPSIPRRLPRAEISQRRSRARGRFRNALPG